MANFLLPMIQRAEGAYELRNVRTGRIVAHTIIPAFESATRRKGLLGRDSLEEGVAMIIAPSNAIHTFWMRFAIDVAFVRRNGEVVKVQEALAPWRVAIGLGAYAVIELAADTLRRADVRVGDSMTLKACSDAMDERFELGRLVGENTASESRQVLTAARVSANGY
jgi:uncharacterized membrane protein (UPF0127 family)